MSIRPFLIYVCDNCGKAEETQDWEPPTGWETSKPWDRSGFMFLGMGGSGHSGERCDECITAAEDGRKAGLESRRLSRLTPPTHS